MAKKTKTPNIFDRLRPQPVLNYVFLTAGGLFVYFLLMMSNGNTGGAVIALLLAALGVLARWIIAPILVLCLTTYLLYDPGFYRFGNFIATGRWYSLQFSTGFQLENLLLAAALLAYVMGHFRLTSLVTQSMPSDISPRREPDFRPPRRPSELIAFEELPRALIVAGACLAVGQTAWVAFTFLERATPLRMFEPDTSRFMLFLWLGGLGLMIVSAVAVYVRRARMSRQQAELLLRDVFFHENRRETDRIHRWRKWQKENIARTRAGK